MYLLQQVAFAAVLGVAGWFAFKRVNIIRQTIALGRDEQRPGNLSTMLRVAFGQSKMFSRPIVGVMHFVIYAGFLLINLEVLEIILDGLLGTHRLFSGLLGGFYGVLINFFETLAVGVLLVCVVFLARRNLTKVDRLQPTRHRELNGWPVLDANVILITEIVLMFAILSMNATDSILQERGDSHYPGVGTFFFSGMLKPLFAGLSTPALVATERIAWWLHILGILAFAVYVTYSKHLHIFLAFPNTYFANQNPNGQMDNMPVVTHEVKMMLGLPSDTPPTDAPARFGAKDVHDLSWKNLMDAYSCTECGRCTSVCPANLTGKQLSPRKIMMDTRDRLEDLGKRMTAGLATTDDGKSLYGDYISAEELRACTTCQACVEACPVMISPLDIITQLRRYQVMEEADAPQSWNMMFQNLDNNQAPWKFSNADRTKWVDDLV